MAELVRLEPDKILETARRLESRIGERFPESGLSRVCAQLVHLAEHARGTTDALARPSYGLRALSYAIVAGIVVASVGAVVAAVKSGSHGRALGWGEIVQISEAGVNDLVLLGAAIFFLVSFETRVKRGQVVRALRDIRSLAHLIDVHQLAKNPDVFGSHLEPTPSSPVRTLTPEEMTRYLDYCSEMLSLAGKVAALYGEGFTDGEATEAVNDVEELCIGLQRKIWQKIVILESRQGGRVGTAALRTG